MPLPVVIHYRNTRLFADPHLRVTYGGATATVLLPATGADAFGPIFAFEAARLQFSFTFKEGAGLDGRWEPPGFDRRFRPVSDPAGPVLSEVWCTGDKPFIYPMSPREPEAQSAEAFLRTLVFREGQYVPGSGGLSGLGSHGLRDGGVLFGFYHPNAARVFVAGTFNDWQRPGHVTSHPVGLVELSLHRGFFDYPNTWLVVVPSAAPGDEYKFFVFGGVPSDDENRLRQHFTDPYARRLGPHFGFNNSVVHDPAAFTWSDDGWRTPDIADLVLYELSVYGFTEGDMGIMPAHRGRFAGITERIERGYFERLGVNALCLMPLAEVPSPQGPTSLGYDPSLYFAVERDFGSPDELRGLVDAAHRHGLAVLLDQVFNHTSSSFNPLWRMVLEHPDEEFSGDGGLYFGGATDWGNRVDTGKTDVQHMLIDACKLWIAEYHVDGFRFDATHSRWMDHGFLLRMAEELKGFEPRTLLIAENLPNEADLNRDGWNGYAQWCDPFHDRLKALLREDVFGDQAPDAESLGGIFYFSRRFFAAHTNNVVNFVENHDETSVPFEIGTNPRLDQPATKDRKGRLGLFATLVALGQPMLYMGQEFGVERPAKFVSFEWPDPPESSGFYQWASRLVHLRRRYPGLRMSGFDPAGDGRFEWILGPWMDGAHGGGRRVIGWRVRPNGAAFDRLAVLMNFEGVDVPVNLRLGRPGIWLKLADLDRVNDVPPAGRNSIGDSTALHTADGNFAGFVLPSSSGFIYKWDGE
ncbi:MAG: alpha-amylase family glycosyl hydrolase [Acidobacteriota bacterium]|nr:alpha-amylase family glycosyl hydrolase [Acidobacteriota bacterium]